MESKENIKVKSQSGFYKLGNTYCLGINGAIIFHIGPDWVFNIYLLLIITLANFFFFIAIAPRVNLYLKLTGILIYLGSLLSYLTTALKNPGIILNSWEIDLEEGKSTPAICKICDVLIEKDSDHCFECQLCIRGHDHHCPLSGKCIGSGNIVPFYCFLFLVVCSFVYFAAWFCILVINSELKSS